MLLYTCVFHFAQGSEFLGEIHSAFHPFVVGKRSYIDYWAGDHSNRRLKLRTAVWLQAKVRERVLELRPRLNAGHMTYSCC